MNPLRTVVFAIVLLHAWGARANVVFSSFGPGTGYDHFNGANVDGPGTALPQSLAEQFSPTASVTLDSVEFAASTTIGSPSLTMGVFSDWGDAPGDLLEEVGVAGFANGVVAVNFSGSVVLVGGNKYWLGLFATGSNHHIWHDSTSGQFALQAASDDDGATWATFASDPFPRAAFRVNGAAVAPPDLSFIAEGAAWRYFRGLAEPSAGTAWTTAAFVDTPWDFDLEGFGYDTDPVTQPGLMSAVATPLSDMRDDGTNPNAYTTLYLRRNFSVPDPAAVAELVLQLDYDDSFIAYVNGVEMTRSAFGTVNTPEPFDALGSDHESTNGDPGKSRFVIDLTNDFPGLLHAGSANVLAIQGLNVALDDADFVLSRISLGANVALAYSADFDGNGSVNGADLLRWRSGFGMATGAAALQGDADGDQDVDGDDFLEWQRQVGGRSMAAARSVPEPATLVPLTIAAAWSCLWRCRHRWPAALPFSAPATY